jgi:teichuronic acid biosynthesis glycosyltransferase TuaC
MPGPKERRLPPGSPINVLTLSSLYPNRDMPQHGIFVENRLRRLVDSGEVASLVIAPVPWFPSADRRFGRYATFARVPQEEMRHGIAVLHPRYALIPKLGMASAPALMYASLRGCLERVLRERFRFDLIDAHYLYPDGVAAVMLAERLGKPAVITARGTDVNLIADFRLPRRWMRWAADRAAGIVAVSEALRARLVDLGIAAGRIRVLRNGVDLDLFAPRDRDAARRELGLWMERPVVLAVGQLVAAKAFELVIRAVAPVPKAILLIVGDGPEAAALRRLAEHTGVASRVRFLGAMPQERLPAVYNAADVLVLASSREGFPNVLLEALACGTPAIATTVGGTPEILASPVAGRLVEERSAEALSAALRDLLADPPPRAAVRAYAERFGWRQTTARQLRLFKSVLDRRD